MNATVIERIGPVGALLAMFSCPVCLPVFAVAGTALGMGAFQPFEGNLFIVFSVLVVIATIGHVIAFLVHRKLLPLVIGLASPALVFAALYLNWSNWVLFLGLLGLFIASPMNFLTRPKSAAN